MVREGRIGAREVAEHAGCSVSAVSLVVNGKDTGRISAELRERVLAAVTELGYRPNRSARSLVTGDSGTVCAVLPDPANPFFGDVLAGLGTALGDEHTLALVLPTSGTDYDARTVLRAYSLDPAGVVLISPGEPVLRDLVPRCPTLVVDAPGRTPALPRVDLDTVAAGELISDHLTALGHRGFGYIGPTSDKPTFRTRRRAFLDRVADADVLRTLDLPGWDPLAAAVTMASVLPEWLDSGVTAVVCADDLLAYGVLAALDRLGRGEVAVVGMGDLPFSQLCRPALTSVDFAGRRAGEVAGRSLLSWIGTGERPRRTRVPANLVVRASTRGG
ncbi:LacI family DNA-binding transcriptional regulator [Allokutzneria oryzae]|uniref:LacI family DNA-binding transcriptional regulator n=1 Tax=Allokutzneria oryzae TaxID=1378989 RepID=A0ABV5ZRB5_9PSEU